MPIGLLIITLLAGSLTGCESDPPIDTSKPWTYWWWMGSAVDSTNIERQLDDFVSAGIGGVHIIPIYGAKGYEEQFLDFLSEEWMQMVHFTMAEAKKLGLGVDMTLGTGWPFGGPMIERRTAAQRLRLRQVTGERGYDWPGWVQRFTEEGREEPLLLVAQQDTTRIALDWRDPRELPVFASRGSWEFNLFTLSATGQKVKRAAPGGEGLVLDYFEQGAILSYLAHFDSVLQSSEWPITPRAVYHDSYETYGANWTSQFPRYFEEMHGYEIMPQLLVLLDTASENRSGVMHDLRATISELLYREFAQHWTHWSTERGYGTRYQAHGSPGNLLDLYALADIPETESFGCSAFPIPGLMCDKDFQSGRFGRPDPLTMKFASSPAHLTGKRLVSAETATWLGNHFKVSLRDVKPQIDELFVAGINHIFFHGTTYSPEEEAYPGWLFCASTHFGATSHFYDELPLLTGYIQRCQEVLQASKPDNDILLYFPISDLWTKEGGDPLLMLDVHHAEDWFQATPFGRAADYLQTRGYAFDYVSDRQLTALEVDNEGKVALGEAAYQVIVLPEMDVIPKNTAEALAELREAGAEVRFIQHYPVKHTGWLAHESGSIPELRGMPVTTSLEEDLQALGIRRETMADQGLQFIRKRMGNNELYFITNLGSRTVESFSLSTTAPYVIITDPLTGKEFYADRDGLSLNMPPGRSYILQATKDRPTLPQWDPSTPSDRLSISGPWRVSFEGRGPSGLRPAYMVDSLVSWTDWGDSLLQFFTGKATYETDFEWFGGGGAAANPLLQFDQISETAEVHLNGVYVGTLWAFPNTLEVPLELLKPHNQLKIVVQNVSANYMRKVDAEQPDWRKFYDINFVDITYAPFDAAEWSPESAGIIGEIHLIY